MDLNLKGKKVVVFGSSAGIGRSIAKNFVNEGAQVVINGRNQERLENTAKEIGTPYTIKADLSIKSEAKVAIEKVTSNIGYPDIVVINTGGPKKGAFMDITQDQWAEDYQNLWMSTTDIIKVVLPKMKEQNFGRILLVSSIAAVEPLKDLTTSNGLRAGLLGLFKSLSKEYAEFGVTFNTILPGYTNTDRLKALNLAQETINKLIPAKRLGEPSEIANLSLFLSSDKAGYITGQSIAVDGGVLNSH